MNRTSRLISIQAQTTRHTKSDMLKAVAAAVISTFSLTSTAWAGLTCNVSGEVRTCIGDGASYDVPFIEGSGGPGAVHTLHVSGLLMDGTFTSSADFNNTSVMPYPAAISLGGNNGTLGSVGTMTWDYGDLTMSVIDSTITGIAPAGIAGLYARTDSANAKTTITTNSTINMTGLNGRVSGILGESFGLNGAVEVNLLSGANIQISNPGAVTSSAGVRMNSSQNGPVSVLTEQGTMISTTGSNTSGISINAGTINLRHGGVITTQGDKGRGIYAVANGGDVSVISSGNVTTNGVDASGIRAETSSAATQGNIYVTMTGGTIDVSGDQSDGIHANIGDEFNGASVASSGSVTLDVTGNLITRSTGTSDAIFGGVQSAGGTGNISITYRAGEIQTLGSNARGLYGRQYGHGSLDISNLSGTVTTAGAGSHGILAISSQEGAVTVRNGGSIQTGGSASHGISV